MDETQYVVLREKSSHGPFKTKEAAHLWARFQGEPEAIVDELRPVPAGELAKALLEK